MTFSPQVKVYVPAEVSFSFGPVNVHGWAAESFIRLEPDGDDTTDDAGVDGEVVIVPNGERRETCTISLMQTSLSNSELSVYSNLVRNGVRMAGAIQALRIKDLNGTFIYDAPNAWILRPPTIEFSNKPVNREWKFRIAHGIRADNGTIGYVG